MTMKNEWDDIDLEGLDMECVELEGSDMEYVELDFSEAARMRRMVEMYCDLVDKWEDL